MATQKNIIHTELNAADNLTPALDRASKSIANFDQKMRDTQRGFRMIRGGGAQLSMQVQDIAVQLQSGTHFMTVFAQQGSQIASLFGAGGAFIGAFLAVGAAIGQTLLPRLFETVDVSEEIDKSYRALAKTLNIDFKNSISGVSEELKRAAEIGGNYAKVILAQNVANATAKVTDNVAKLEKATEELNDEFRGGERPGTGMMLRFDELSEAMGLTRQEFLNYRVAVRRAVSGDEEAIRSYGDVAAALLLQQEAGGAVNDRFRQLVNSHMELVQSSDQATQQIQLSKKVLGDLEGTLNSVDTAFNSDKAASDSFITSLEKQTAMMGMTKAQSIAYQATLYNLNDEQWKSVAAAIEAALAEEEAAKAKKDAADAAREKKQADADANRELQFMLDLEQRSLEFAQGIIEATKKKAEERRKEAEAIRGVIDSLGLMTGEEQIQAQYDKRLDGINKLLEDEKIAEQTAIDLKLRAYEKYYEDLNNLRRTSSKFEERDAMGKTQMVLGELDSMFAGVKANNKKMFAVAKAYNIAKAIMSTATGATKALETYPPPLSFAMAAAQVAAGMAQVATIRAQSFAGGGFTGVGSRSGGMDGKGGFMAMLHPNETVIDHTKGQSQGITIINNIDATGAGADVEAKIQAAMQITSQETIAVIQDLMRRRRFA